MVHQMPNQVACSAGSTKAKAEKDATRVLGSHEEVPDLIKGMGIANHASEWSWTSASLRVQKLPGARNVLKACRR